MRLPFWIAALLLVFGASPSAAEWLRWTTVALPDAPSFCCATRAAGQTKPVACMLEGGDRMYGSFDAAPRSDMLQIYARYEADILAEVHVYGAACTVQSAEPVRELGVLDGSASLARLLAPIAGGKRVAQDRLVAVAQHPGDASLQWLQQRSRNGARDERHDAWFWLGQRLGADVEPRVRDAFPNADGELREHLVFVLSQMPGAAAVDALIALVEDRRLGRDLRHHALFWLAQSDDARAFAYLERALEPAES